MKHLPKLAVLIILAGAVAFAPARALAQSSSDKAAPEQKSTPEAEKKPKAGPFHGKLVAVDKVSKTITVGKRTFLITSETKLKKDGKPATLDEGVVGEEASGYVKPREDGKLVATTVNFGAKAKPAGAEKKSKDADKEAKQPSGPPK